MPLPENAAMFTADQLSQIDDVLDTRLISWANDINMATPPIVRQLAYIAGWSTIARSKGHESDFRGAVEAGHKLETPLKNLGYKPPIQAAGLAAGLAVKTALLIRWYDLDASEFATAPVDIFRVMSDPRSEPLERAVGSLPKQIGIADFTMHDVFLDTMFAAEEAIRRDGPEALDQFLQGRPTV